MVHEIEALTASLISAQSEIDELRRARTPLSPEKSLIVEPSNKEELIRLQEEKDDALFALQQANQRISDLESEREDLTERAEAANAEARDMARHSKELREQVHELEAELATSRSNVGVANRGNSMFAEFAEERLKLEADMKSLYAKYEAVRKQNYQLSNELDEARLLALRRTRSEVS
ncbi:unnamed protein product [Strongylus vulgaris]|uniref:Uncharacterized protein n=1 Tax=Strongylus vulgaris TaxID=40348 RepID=A0A3P7ISN6_STRVU|nr:unnamed protein product [Strongylus vulgaris]